MNQICSPSLAKLVILNVIAFKICYVGGKFETQKSCEIQTIYAILRGNIEVVTMAQNTLLLFTKYRIDPILSANYSERK